MICIDPRASFGQNKTYGDLLFEYAKIYESVNGLYDLIIEDKCKYTMTKDGISYKINVNKKVKNIQKQFDTFFPINFLKEIKLIEALQFMCMLPFHDDHYDRQIVFLCHGLTRFYEIIKKE
jgi:hypothetical protein